MYEKARHGNSIKGEIMLKQSSLDIFDQEEEQLIETTYTKKINVPLYVPKYQKPSVHELFDHSKTLKLIQRINKSSLNDEEKKFLTYAAQRHTVLNFAKIADFYAHSSAEMQDLMEQSALVIVDFDKALENGYVVLNNELSNQYLDDQNG
jgi:hypothetical protein